MKNITMSLLRGLCAMALVSVTACTGATVVSAGNVVDGTLGGMPFPAADATSFTTDANGSPFGGPSTGVMLASFSGACTAAVAQNKSLGSFIAFDLVSVDASGATSPITQPGTYTVVGAKPASAALVAEVSWVGDTVGATGVSGTVVVTSLDDGVAGTFDVAFDDGSHVTGSFDAPDCPGFDP